MANEDLSSLSNYRLRLEFERLDGRRETLEQEIRSRNREIERLSKSVKTNIGITAGGGILTIVSFASALISPPTAAFAILGFGLAYLGGRGCQEDHVGVQTLREELARQQNQLQAIKERIAAIAEVQQTRKRT